MSSKHVLLAMEVDTQIAIGSVCVHELHVGTTGGVPLQVVPPDCVAPNDGLVLTSPPSTLIEPPPLDPTLAEATIQIAIATRVDDPYKRDLFIASSSPIYKLVVVLEDTLGNVAAVTSAVGGVAAQAGFTATLVDNAISFDAGPTGNPIDLESTLPTLFTTLVLDPLSLGPDVRVCLSSATAYAEDSQSLDAYYFPCETKEPPPGQVTGNDFLFPPPPQQDADMVPAAMPIPIPGNNSVDDLSPSTEEAIAPSPMDNR